MGCSTDSKLRIQKIAVEQNGLAIQHIPAPSEELCILACKQNGLAIQYINDPTEQMWEIAVRQNGLAIQFMDFVSNLEEIYSEEDYSTPTTPIPTPEEETPQLLPYIHGYSLFKDAYVSGDLYNNNQSSSGNEDSGFQEYIKQGWIKKKLAVPMSTCLKDNDFDSGFNFPKDGPMAANSVINGNPQLAYKLHNINYEIPSDFASTKNLPYCIKCFDTIDTNIMCDNNCSTVRCGCGDEYYLDKGTFVKGHNPKCGDIFSDEDSFEEIH